jgi:phospholipase C
MAQNIANPNITQVFVLMLENRSFDHMLGFSGLTGTDPATGGKTSINGVSPANINTYLDVNYPVTNNADNRMPFDPGHEFPDVVEQLCGAGVQYGGGAYPPINNSGFVSNYATTKSSGEGGATTNFGEIMKCYNTAAQLPILTALAENFAVCDNWYASLPGPTWPNRFFVHAASSDGLDHSPTTLETTDWEVIDGFSFSNGTLYQLMDNHKNTNKGWRLYRGVASPLIGSLPCVAALKGIQLKDTHRYEDFQSDIHGDYPYSYTFIEPNYGDIINSSYAGGQSQHPMDDVRNGEALIKSTYEAIRNSPLWLNSLLIITYDEHGGFYDHVAPSAAKAPGDTAPNSKFNKYGFDFQHYGVRVVALVISAYTTKNLISHQVYDHSSVPATVEALFNLPALTQRDASANNLTSLASLGTARTDTPATLPPVAAIAGEQPAIMPAAMQSARIVQNEDTASADSGNLPAFLHIALKAKREQEGNETTRTMMKGDFITHVNSKADARKYLEASLPGLLTASQNK